MLVLQTVQNDITWKIITKQKDFITKKIEMMKKMYFCDISAFR